MQSRGEQLRERATSAVRESKLLDFKAQFLPDRQADWCELIKDLVAMANSGGGIIVFGVNDDGSLNQDFQDHLSQLDPADITNKIFKYTGMHLSGFEIMPITRGKSLRPAVVIEPTDAPVVFTSPGTYAIDGPKPQQRSAFSQGTLYFRHGAKSEPATQADIRAAFDRLLQTARRGWLQGIRKVVQTAPGTHVSVTDDAIALSDRPDATPVRLTDDPSAQALSAPVLSTSHPLRQKDVIQALRSRIGNEVHLTAHTLLCIRRAHGIDDKLTFSYRPPFGSRLYSHALVDWIVKQYEKDHGFLNDAYEQYKQQHQQES